MKVFLEPTGLHSRAMVRVSRALTRYAPSNVKVVSDINKADIDILHVIGSDAIGAYSDLHKPYVAIQYCLHVANLLTEGWSPFWRGAELVWSYYLLPSNGFNFYHAPLGIDEVFKVTDPPLDREPLLLTLGYVSSSEAEPIEECWRAAGVVGVKCIHIGPSKVVGIDHVPDHVTTMQGVSDQVLATLYSRASWVAALRHVEGFELPALEGLACGARPIAFDQWNIKHWYGAHAYLVKDESGDALIDSLVKIMSQPFAPVTEGERKYIFGRFSWETICTGFWERLLGRQEVET